MDINFHYFAVKAVAVKAGFQEKDAQIIASYSQFVDDFSNYHTMFFEDIPDFAQYLATKTTNGWLFSPVTTGFNSWLELARLIIPENQRKIAIPFHFIPKNKKLNQPVKDRTKWRVIPASLDSPSLIQKLLLKAKEAYKKNGSTVNLIKIGTLLHIFADTYAHQNFSGFWNWENNSKLTSARNNIDESNILSSYSPKIHYKLPSIGHTNVNHVLDDSNVSFGMLQKLDKNDDYSIKYSRNNTREYLTALHEIINYLRSCIDLNPINQRAWDEMSQNFAKGFLTPSKDINALSIYWHNIFPDITFDYNKQDLYKLDVKPMNTLKKRYIGDYRKFLENNPDFEGMVYTANSDYFFHYNVIADEIRRYVNGQ